MIGAIAGDIIGSVYEKSGIKTKDFKLFCEDSRYTDDTVMSIAILKSIITNLPTQFPNKPRIQGASSKKI